MLTHFISWQELQLVSYDKTYLEQNKSRLMHSSFFCKESITSSLLLLQLWLSSKLKSQSCHYIAVMYNDI